MSRVLDVAGMPSVVHNPAVLEHAPTLWDVYDRRFPIVMKTFESPDQRWPRRLLWKDVLFDPRDHAARVIYADAITEWADELPEVVDPVRSFTWAYAELIREQVTMETLPACPACGVTGPKGCPCGRYDMSESIARLAQSVHVPRNKEYADLVGRWQDEVTTDEGNAPLMSILSGVTPDNEWPEPISIITHGAVSALVRSRANWFHSGPRVVSVWPIRYVHIIGFPPARSDPLRDVTVDYGAFRHTTPTPPRLFPWETGETGGWDEVDEVTEGRLQRRVSTEALRWARKEAGLPDVDPLTFEAGQVGHLLQSRLAATLGRRLTGDWSAELVGY